MAPTHSNGAPRAVLYLRMSSEEQDQSIPAQRTELERYAHKQGYKIVGEYLDSAISGDDTHKRNGFLRMREDAGSGKFDLVLCWDQDRFGRFDLLEGGYWITPFREAQVRLETIAQGPIDWEDLVGQLIYSVNQMGKAQFLRDLSRNTTRGLLSYAREARSGTGGRTPYGYKVENGSVSIVTSEAKIVRWIFAEYLKPSGSLRSIAGELNRRKVPPPNKARGISRKTAGVWRGSSVRAILDRRKYLGEFVHGSQNAGRYHSMQEGEIVPRRKSDKKIKSEPIIIPDRFEAIIDRKTFDQAQAKLGANKTKTSPRSARQYLLAGLMKCGDCGGAMGGLRPKAPFYRCRLYHQTGRSSCYCNSIPEAPLVSVIVDKIRSRYLSDSALARLRKALEREQERTKPKPRDLSRLKREVEKLNAKIDNAEDSVLEAPANLRAGLYRKLEDLAGQRDRLNTELEALSRYETKANGKDDTEINRAIKALKNLSGALKRAKPEETKELLASIVTKIELHFDHQETDSGTTRNTFREGTIYVRPDAGAARSSDPGSTNMIKNRPGTGTSDQSRTYR